MRTIRFAALLAAAFAAHAEEAAAPVVYRLHGQAWTDIGRVMEASKTTFGNTADSIDVDNGSIQSTGAQLMVEADLTPNLTGQFGFGVRQITNSQGLFREGEYSPYLQSVTMWRGYVAQANLTWFMGQRHDPGFSVTLGSFSHEYNRDAHNLGGYLLRGPVYPGILMSGFQEFALDSTKATQTGVRVQHRMGMFSHSLLFVNENELPPTFDWSLAYIAKFRPHAALELGAGVNLYRLVPYSRKLQTTSFDGDLERDSSGNWTGNWTLGNDTVDYTHQGTKLMAMFSLDLKHLLPVDGFGPEDLKLYGEAALLGVRHYGPLYDDYTERIPVMLGFNVPTWRVLDRLSVEVEWYGSPYRNDLYNIGNPNSMVAPWRWNPQRPIPSPIPVQGVAEDDDWRWSVLLEKNLVSSVRFTAQVASDHYRPLPFGTGLIYQEGGTGAAFLSPKEWYFMARLGFFF